VDPIAEVLFNYLRDVLYSPARAALDLERLPQGFRDLGEGLKYLAECISETRKFANALSKGDLDGEMPSSGNEVAAPLKSLHASLKHLTWQTQQVAQGDYLQRVEFMGNFSRAFNAMVQQLDERHKINEDTKYKLQQYVNLLLSNCPDIILLFDVHGHVVLTSVSYLQHCGIEDASIIRDKSFHELFSPVLSDAFLQHMTGLLQAAVAYKCSSEMEQAIAFGQDDRLRHYSIQVIPMLDERGTAVGTMLFFHDMTESVRAQHAAERARELAEQSTRAKSDFLARMSHEMRTPMNAIIGMTTIAKTADAPERKIYCLDKINEASQHLLGVINDILDMSKIEADQLELSLGECNVAQMMQRVVGSMNFRIEERKQALSLDIDTNIPATIISDEQRLSQVITNLLTNAVKFTPEHGAIALTAKKIAEEDEICTIRFVVKDTGIGISEEQRNGLFASFEQADGGISRKFGGTGLGLAIAKRIIDMMDGRIWVESELGKGASFLFEIRVKTGASSKEASQEGPACEAHDGALGGIFAGKRALVADDVEINREIVASLLEDTGIETVFAVDGAEAVAKFSAAPDAYDLILMDIHMPDVDGYEATRQIRASGLRKADSIPIIAMTANVFREDIERCLASGMNSHLGKPLDVAVVIAELKKHLL